MLVLDMAIDGATTGARRMRSSRTAHGLSISTAVRPSGRPMARNTSCVQVEPDLFVLREKARRSSGKNATMTDRLATMRT